MKKALNKKRLDQLEALKLRKENLTTEEYLFLLKEILKHSVVNLAMAVIKDEPYNTGAHVNIIDKTHWLIDSVEKISNDIVNDNNYVISYEYELPKEAEA